MELIKEEEDGTIRYYRLSNGSTIIIEVSSDRIEVRTDTGSSIGHIDLTETEDGFHYITYMFLNGENKRYLRQGIGRQALKFFKESIGTKVYAAENDGHTREDGSHLTGDAPAFVSQMRDEGIIEPLCNEDEDVSE